MGKPSLIAALLRQRGCIRLVVKTAVFPVWQKHSNLSSAAKSSTRRKHGFFPQFCTFAISCLYRALIIVAMGKETHSNNAGNA